MSNLGELYSRLYEAYKKAYALKPKQKIQQETNELWSTLKKSESVVNSVDEKVKELNLIATRKKTQQLSFFSKVSLKTTVNTVDTQQTQSHTSSQASSTHSSTQVNNCFILFYFLNKLTLMRTFLGQY